MHIRIMRRPFMDRLIHGLTILSQISRGFKSEPPPFSFHRSFLSPSRRPLSSDAEAFEERSLRNVGKFGERWDHGLETDEILTDSQNGIRARRERSGVIVIYRFVTEAYLKSRFPRALRPLVITAFRRIANSPDFYAKSSY